jgi:hypothetical protein
MNKADYLGKISIFSNYLREDLQRLAQRADTAHMK